MSLPTVLKRTEIHFEINHLRQETKKKLEMWDRKAILEKQILSPVNFIIYLIFVIGWKHVLYHLKAFLEYF